MQKNVKILKKCWKKCWNVEKNEKIFEKNEKIFEKNFKKKLHTKTKFQVFSVKKV